MLRATLVAVLLLILGSSSHALAETLSPGKVPNNPPNSSAMELPPEVTGWFRNPDGSCVQCSGGMVGVHNNLLVQSTLLWDTPYGRAERGGSGPGRVASYARARGMRIYNVTGEAVWPMMEWAAQTGRFAAIGAGGSHFQTFYGRAPVGSTDPHAGTWFVCNNNSTGKVDVYDWASFRRLHLASGEWIWMPDEPPAPPPPRVIDWWSQR